MFARRFHMLAWLLAMVIASVAWAKGLLGQTEDARLDPASEKSPVTFTVADGAIELAASGNWTQVEPAFKMIEAEFKIPRVEEDQDRADGRLTIMSSGGSIQQNLQRWYGQFVQPDGSRTESVAKLEEFSVGDIKVYYVDISGTYLDSGAAGPQGPKTERPGYRMLAAILVTPKNGNYFVKFYGPAATIAHHEKPFRELVESARLVD